MNGSLLVALLSNCGALGALGLGGCVGIVPDEIDIAGDEVGESGELGGSEGGATSDDESGTSGTTDTGTEEGTTAADDGTEDTFGDEGTTDEESSTEGPSDTGTGEESDSETGQEAQPCDIYSSGALSLGANDVALVDGPSELVTDCSGEGPEAVYSFTADSAGEHTFTLSGAEFMSGTLSLGGPLCEPFDGLTCGDEDVPLVVTLDLEETLYVVVDSEGEVGAAVVTIEGP